MTEQGQSPAQNTRGATLAAVAVIAIASMLLGQCLRRPHDSAHDEDLQAHIACSSALERQARWDYEWTSSTGRFAPTNRRADGTQTYAGSALKLQNGFGAWRHVSYVCKYSHRDQSVVEAVVIQ